MSSSSLPPNALSRLILLDGCNIMANFKELIEGKRCSFEARPDAMILSILTGVFLNQGWNIRIVLPKKINPDNTVGYVHGDIIDELEHCGIIVRPMKNQKEEDDRAMLQIAQVYGAVVISQDQFNNHIHDFGSVIKNNVITYRNIRNDDFTPEALLERLIIERKFVLNIKPQQLFVLPDHADYKKVEKSIKKFPILSDVMHQRVGTINMFNHEYLCRVVNRCRPNTIPIAFMRAKPFYVLTTFSDFYDKHNDSIINHRPRHS